MPLIMNASSVQQTFSVFGNHFTLKPGQVKNFTDAIANFISNHKQEYGLVALPEEFLDPTFGATEEGKKILAEKKLEGVRNRVARLKQLAYNETVALKMDLEAKNLKTDPRVLMSESMMAQLEELANYMDDEDKSKQEQIERIKKLEKRLVGKIDKQE